MHACVLGLQRSEDNIRSPGTGVTGGCQLPYGSWTCVLWNYWALSSTQPPYFFVESFCNTGNWSNQLLLCNGLPVWFWIVWCSVTQSLCLSHSFFMGWPFISIRSWCPAFRQKSKIEVCTYMCTQYGEQMFSCPPRWGRWLPNPSGISVTVFQSGPIPTCGYASRTWLFQPRTVFLRGLFLHVRHWRD